MSFTCFKFVDEKPNIKSSETSSREVYTVLDEDSEIECLDDAVLPRGLLIDRSCPQSTSSSMQESDVIILGPHRITDRQLYVLETGDGELADSILDGFCFALSHVRISFNIVDK